MVREAVTLAFLRCASSVGRLVRWNRNRTLVIRLGDEDLAPFGPPPWADTMRRAVEVGLEARARGEPWLPQPKAAAQRRPVTVVVGEVVAERVRTTARELRVSMGDLVRDGLARLATEADRGQG